MIIHKVPDVVREIEPAEKAVVAVHLSPPFSHRVRPNMNGLVLEPLLVGAHKLIAKPGAQHPHRAAEIFTDSLLVFS